MLTLILYRDQKKKKKKKKSKEIYQSSKDKYSVISDD